MVYTYADERESRSFTTRLDLLRPSYCAQRPSQVLKSLLLVSWRDRWYYNGCIREIPHRTLGTFDRLSTVALTSPIDICVAHPFHALLAQERFAPDRCVQTLVDQLLHGHAPVPVETSLPQQVVEA